MNFAFELSLAVEDNLRRLKNQADLDPFVSSAALYRQALAEAVATTQGKAWAAGNIRM